MGNDLVLTGRSALLTGGGSGIGLGCAARLLRDGASVTITGRSEDTLRAAAAELEQLAPETATVQWVASDVADEETWPPRWPGRSSPPEGSTSRSRPPAPAPSARSPPSARGVAPRHRHQPHRSLSHPQARRCGHAALGRRIDRRHLVDRRAADPPVHGGVLREQGRARHPGAGGRRRARSVQRPGQLGATGAGPDPARRPAHR